MKIEINMTKLLTVAALLGTGIAFGSYVSVIDAKSAGGVIVNEIVDTTPVGTVAMWATSTPPVGWIEMNGQSTSGYPELSAVIGANVPDLRGQFVRAWDNGKGVDSSRQLLTSQGDAIRNITGSFRSLTRYPSASGSVSYTSSNTTDYSSGNTHPYGRNYTFDASKQVPTANENRPKNIALMYIIKAESSQSN